MKAEADMKKALLIGDKNCAAYKSINGAAEVLPQIFSCEMDIADETTYGTLTYEDIKDYDMIVFKPADWGKTGTTEATVALFTYILHGGNILALNTGLNVGNCQELKLLFTSRFKAEAPYTEVDFILTNAELAAGVETVTVRDIPMMFNMDIFKQTNILMNIKFGNTTYPAVWAHPWSKGKVACLAAGLNGENLKAFEALLKNIGSWFMA